MFSDKVYGADLLSLAEGIRRYGGRAASSAQGVGAGECASEASGGRSSAGQRDIERGVPGKLLSPTRRRAAVVHVRETLFVSERRSCRVLGQVRRTQRYTPKVADDEEALIEGLAEDTTHLTSPKHRSVP